MALFSKLSNPKNREVFSILSAFEPFRWRKPQRFDRLGSVVLLWAISLSTIACNSPVRETVSSAEVSSSEETQTKVVPDTVPKDNSPPPKPKSEPKNGDRAGETYQEPDGAFEIALPPGYQTEETGSGIKFISADGGFKGIVDFAAIEEDLGVDRLEGALRQYLEETLTEVEWQNSRLEPDGSVRVDWVGKSPQGEQLDAVSYIEQRGNTLYTLSLYGVNKAFDDYSEDVAIVLKGYKLKSEAQEESEEAAPEES